MQQDLGVGPRLKGAALPDQLVAQLEVVVDFAVKDEVEAPIGSGHRLPAGRRQVEDRQPAVQEEGLDFALRLCCPIAS